MSEIVAALTPDDIKFIESYSMLSTVEIMCRIEAWTMKVVSGRNQASGTRLLNEIKLMASILLDRDRDSAADDALLNAVKQMASILLEKMQHDG
jgi:hypothetical protein